VICGHIHQPKIRGYSTDKGSVIYMNSGDWIENLTALEYDGDQWTMYRYNEEEYATEQRIEKILKNRNQTSKMVIG